jgi:hypothetical protein
MMVLVRIGTDDGTWPDRDCLLTARGGLDRGLIVFFRMPTYPLVTKSLFGFPAAVFSEGLGAGCWRQERPFCGMAAPHLASR